MKRRFSCYTILLFCAVGLVGCGGDGSGLVTEQGSMTIQEYEQLQADIEAKDAELRDADE
ncbi:hypothetical protein SAMN06265222_10845 [Neorhodopirellula lusitana]|uniref:Secreted protein n=1 Tax=Neorhodopirellula lusitana TaxID=445327 RepID=A0ABY1Q8R3_9BACT|nr:hypothetical protein [Neorhodopirellula lusitana]SMP63306.1 hypothetical protein SAMN06265222_10845 [Neorhodopirellula lusitana]